MEQVVEADPRSGLVKTFESSVDLGVLLNCIGWHRAEEHGEASFLSFNEISVNLL